MLTTIYIIVLVALGIGTLILAHEFGHFLGAKLMGVKVEEFMIGLPGPKIFSFKRNETEYGITWLLIGGYVKMLSEYHEEIDEVDKKRAFSHQPFWKRFIIMISGPLMNFVLPVIIVTFLILGQGIFVPTTTIEAVEVSSPAFVAGIEKGDKIIRVNDNSVGQWAEVLRIIQNNPGEEVQFVVKRNNENIELKAVLDDKEGKGFLGITSKVINEKGTFFVAIYKSIKFNFAVSVSIVRLTYQIIAENIFFKVVSGPVGIAVETAKAARAGFDAYLGIIVYINLFVMIFNLLPIPPLDGGRIVIALFESFTKKPLKYEVMMAIQLIGLSLFIMLFLYVITADLQRYGIWGLKLWDLKQF